MTNKERLISLLGFAPDNNALEGALLDAGIAGSDVYANSNLLTLKKAQLELLELLFSTADTSFFNGATTSGVRYDRATLLKKIEALKDELGLVAGLPTITSKSVW